MLHQWQARGGSRFPSKRCRDAQLSRRDRELRPPDLILVLGGLSVSVKWSLSTIWPESRRLRKLWDTDPRRSVLDYDDARSLTVNSFHRCWHRSKSAWHGDVDAVRTPLGPKQIIAPPTPRRMTIQLRVFITLALVLALTTEMDTAEAAPLSPRAVAEGAPLFRSAAMSSGRARHSLSQLLEADDVSVHPALLDSEVMSRPAVGCGWLGGRRSSAAERPPFGRTDVLLGIDLKDEAQGYAINQYEVEQRLAESVKRGADDVKVSPDIVLAYQAGPRTPPRGAAQALGSETLAETVSCATPRLVRATRPVQKRTAKLKKLAESGRHASKRTLRALQGYRGSAENAVQQAEDNLT
ncbi:uncharacterized protein PSFLO_06905 [Pseudozyma flocculosa]|uniref:Uncharacterized protein n=1 Tax=Pseudozyma flocculosa TaxID=84751 RepID=A0A5C3FAE3_9BASI|nr:uncharacterized protein PSFLO_06905 [Pseudozyma flocculosa]